MLLVFLNSIYMSDYEFETTFLQGRRDAPPQDGGGGSGGQGGGGGGGMEFDSWRHQTHQPPSAAFNHMSSTMDPYMSSFYGSQYFPGYGVGDGTWSNGGDPAMTFLGNYGQGMQVSVLWNPCLLQSITLSFDIHRVLEGSRFLRQGRLILWQGGLTP